MWIDSHSKLPGNEDSQAENLFVNRTISEIRQIEQKARFDHVTQVESS